MHASSGLNDLARDLRYAIRSLARARGFTFTAVLLLALSIGTNTAIFSVVSAAVLRPLPFADPDRLVLLWDDFSSRGGPANVESAPADFVTWRDESRSFDGIAAFVPNTYNLTGQGDPEKLAGIRTTANLFVVLGMHAVAGRTLLPDDERTDRLPVVVLSEELWRRRFGGDQSIIGRTIELDGLKHTVVGVVPSHFPFPNRNAALWIPARFSSAELAQSASYYFYVLARLKAATSVGAAQAELATIADRAAQRRPENVGVHFVATPLHQYLVRDVRPAMSMLLGAVGLVLLIACANLANLLLVRGAGRRKEMAIRKALGAGPARLARQLLVECLVVTTAGAVLGVALSTATFHYLARLLPAGLPLSTTPGVDPRVLLFTAMVTVLVVVAAGVVPTLAATRTPLVAAFRTAGRGVTATGRRMRSALVVVEVTLTVALLIGAGLLLRSYTNVLAVDPGFNAHDVLLAETVLPPSKYGPLQNRTAFYDDVLERVRALPTVSRAAYANFPPLVFKGGRVVITIEGRPVPTPAEFARFMTVDRVVSAGYFATLNVPVIRGREFDRRDGDGAPLAIVINDTLARAHWPGQDPLGRRIRIGASVAADAPWFTIVGIVGNIRQMALDVPPEPELYLSANQVALNAPFFWPQYLIVRTKGAPLAIAANVRRAVWSVDRDEPVANIRPMTEVLDAELLNRNTQLTLVGAFAVLALLIAAIGLYSVLACTVTQQLREIAVKMALGARRIRVVAEVLRDALTVTSLGVVLGLLTAWASSRLLASFLFGVTTTDTLTYGLTALVLGLTALLASCVPALRGASVDPSSILRSD